MIGLYVGNLGMKFVTFKMLARSRRDLTKVQKELNFTARSHQSWRDVETLTANSARFEKPTNIMVRSQQSR